MRSINQLRKIKETGEKFTALVLYDNAFCKIAKDADIDLVIVGDSLAMSICGNPTTISATMDMMLYHTKSVANAADNLMVIADLPYMSYSSIKDALQHSALLMQAGASMVKLEGGQDWAIETVKCLTQYGIPVCAHIGLTPQYYHQIGGHKVMGKQADDYQRILNEAIALDKAGSEMIVLECIPSELGQEITRNVKAVTLGAGAGIDCDGQVMLLYDLIGISGKKIRFAKDYLCTTNSVQQAISNFIVEVKTLQYPAAEHCYS